MATKVICLRQHLQGGTIEKSDIQLSLDELELIYSLCHATAAVGDSNNTDHPTVEAADIATIRLCDPDVPTPGCFAKLHTRDGSVCLEAVEPGISTEALGYGFDGQSAHRGMPLMPSTSGVCTTLQLRPGESFRFKAITMDIVPQEDRDLHDYASTPGGLSYQNYVQQVSQFTNSTPLNTPMSHNSDRAFSNAVQIPTTPKTRLPQTMRLLGNTAIDARKDGPGRTSTPLKLDLPKTIQHKVLHNDLDACQDVGIRPNPIEREASPATRSMSCSALGETESYNLDGGVILSTDKAKTFEDAFKDRRPRTLPPILPNTSVNPAPQHHSAQGTFFAEAQTCQNKHSIAISEAIEGESDSLPSKKKRKLLPKPLSAPIGEPKDSKMFTTHIDAMSTTALSSDPKPPVTSTKFSAAKVSGVLDSSPTREVSSVSLAVVVKPKTPSAQEITPAHSLKPSHSPKSTSSTAFDEHLQPGTSHDNLRVLFASSTTVGDSKSFLKFLSSNGVKVVRSIADCTILCVGKGELKKTGKFILAVLQGKEVVRDSWVIDSAKGKKLQDFSSHVARDKDREWEWRINLDDAIERGRKGIKVFEGWTIIFTSLAKKELGKIGFSELKEIAISAGAINISSILPKKCPEELPQTLIIGLTGEAQLPAQDGWRCYTKDIIGLSVLRGQLDVESDEFLVQDRSRIKEMKKRKRESTA